MMFGVPAPEWLDAMKDETMYHVLERAPSDQACHGEASDRSPFRPWRADQQRNAQPHDDAAVEPEVCPISGLGLLDRE